MPNSMVSGEAAPAPPQRRPEMTDTFPVILTAISIPPSQAEGDWSDDQPGDRQHAIVELVDAAGRVIARGQAATPASSDETPDYLIESEVLRHLGEEDYPALYAAIEEAHECQGQVAFAPLAALVRDALDAYEKATGQWTEADWTHEYVPACHAPEHGTYIPCPRCGPLDEECSGKGKHEDCQTCADAARDAARAEEAAAKAVAALKAGDYHEAESWAEAASGYESTYGDDPTWGSFARACRKLCEYADGQIEDLSAADYQSVVVGSAELRLTETAGRTTDAEREALLAAAPSPPSVLPVDTAGYLTDTHAEAVRLAVADECLRRAAKATGIPVDTIRAELVCEQEVAS